MATALTSLTAPELVLDDDLVLRRHRPDDVDGVWEQCQDPATQRWTTVPVPYGRDDAQHFVTEAVPRMWDEGTEWCFAVVDGGRFAGTIGLRPLPGHRAELGFGAHPAARGTGVMERALRGLLVWGFTDRGLESVLWQAHVGNWASRRLAWKVGFGVSGTLARWNPQRGELRDVWVATLTSDQPLSPPDEWLACPVLEGDGLRLRPVADRDVDRVLEGCTDPETQRWLGQLPSPYTLDDAVAYVEKCRAMLADGVGETWAVTAADDPDDRLLGTMGWFNAVAGERCELGWWTHPDARGRGVTTRAARLAARHVVERRGVRRVEACVAVDNVASRRVAEKVGMRLWGVERRGALTRDGRPDLACYDVLAEELPAG